jgi:DNA-binding PadR family transcriptional regulator
MSNRELTKCVCSGKSLDRFLRPVVMTILCGSSDGLHGYSIEKQLQDFRFYHNNPPDFTGLYRLLKRMEIEGLLSSAMKKSKEGPSKKTYRITAKGKKCLKRWQQSLQEYKCNLEDILEKMEHDL